MGTLAFLVLAFKSPKGYSTLPREITQHFVQATGSLSTPNDSADREASPYGHSAVKVAKEVMQQYDEMQRKRIHRFLVFQVVGQEVIIEKVGGSAERYEDFVAALPKDAPRFGIVDYEFRTKDNRPQTKLIFVHWVPDSSSRTDKVIYAASKENVKRHFSGLAREVQATDLSD